MLTSVEASQAALLRIVVEVRPHTVADVHSVSDPSFSSQKYFPQFFGHWPAGHMNGNAGA